MHMLIYLASPYSHPDKAVELTRFNQTMEITARLMRLGYKVFSPIVHCHPLAISQRMPTSYGFWESYSEAMVSHCDQLWVLKMQGWRESKGVGAEILLAQKLNIPVFYLDARSTRLEDDKGFQMPI